MFGPSTILLVEPHIDSREMYQLALECVGFRVVATGSAADAITLAVGAEVIVTELRVDGPMNSVEMIRRFRGDYPSTVLVVVTTNPFASVRAQAEQAGADVVLVKPCSPETLTDTIERVLAERCVG